MKGQLPSADYLVVLLGIVLVLGYYNYNLEVGVEGVHVVHENSTVFLESVVGFLVVLLIGYAFFHPRRPRTLSWR